MKEFSYSIPIYQIDAFTEISFKGNPAAICLIDQDYDLILSYRHISSILLRVSLLGS